MELVGLLIIVYSLYLLLKCNYELKNNSLNLTPRINNPSICFLIPARFESRVLPDLLESIKNQSVKVNMQDVYVIIEDESDPAYAILKEYNTKIFIRKKPIRPRKGYALDECIKDILKKKHYDLYFIFDADNILDKDYLKNMLDSYYKGYDIAIGYRNTKNGNDSVIASASSLTFSMINTIGNVERNKNNANNIISGTGFFLVSALIEKWGGYPFHSLTEDYELSLYAILNEIKTYYNENAIFYDEQPTKYKVTVKQRIRWIRGYFDSRKKYVILLKKVLKNNVNKGSVYKEIVGVKPYIFFIIGVVLILLENIITIFSRLSIMNIILILSLIYLTLVLITLIMLKKEKLDLSKKSKIKVLFYNPIYLITYIPCAIKAVLKKDVKWEVIEHKNK